MNCPYCHASTTPDDHRCQRCGRRLESHAYARPVYGRGGTARALHYETEAEPTIVSEESAAPRKRPFQPSLFATRIVSFESYAPEVVEPRPRDTAKPSRPRTRKVDPAQESFAFDTVITQPDQAQRVVEPAIVCDDRVALFTHRMAATAIDLSIVVIALGFFLITVWLSGAQLMLSMHTAPLCLGMGVILYLMYELLWCMAGMDTAGMRFVRLKLVDFDGHRPDHEQRLVRSASACLSVLAAGLGVLWTAVDEESLTWHDHISKTFPTPY